jgi:hypothetical protein
LYVKKNRFPKLPVRRHIQESSFLETPQTTNNCKTVVPSTARETHDKEHALYEKARLKIDYFDIEEPLQTAFYKDGIQNLLVCFKYSIFFTRSIILICLFFKEII